MPPFLQFILFLNLLNQLSTGSISGTSIAG